MMTSKTSFFNPSVLRKDLTRFAPVWALYSIALVLYNFLMFGNFNTAEDYAVFVSSYIVNLSAVSMIYAAVCALVLLGDLYVPRMCNALHAMPMRREGWFVTHMAAGLLLALIPNSAASLVMLTKLEEFRFLALYWFAGVTLQHLFFFALAVFSAMCAGNRLGMLAVYGICNFGAAFVYSLAEALYLPLLPGVVLTTRPVEQLWPLYRMMDTPLVNHVYDEHGMNVRFELGSWGYLWILAGIAVVLFGLSLILYRRRHLERAGDLLAVKPLRPVFLVIASLGSGLLLNLFAQLFYGAIPRMVFFFTGMAVGFFVGQMLLERSARVFRPRVLAAFAALAVLVGVSLGLTKLDLFGIVGRIPSQDQIDSASLDFVYHDESPRIHDPEQIRQIMEIHEQLCRNPNLQTGRPDVLEDTEFRIGIGYDLANGTRMTRQYSVDGTSELGQAVARQLYSWQNLLGTDDLQTFWSQLNTIQVYFWEDGDAGYLDGLSRNQAEALVDAIVADAKEGNLVQGQFPDDPDLESCSIELEFSGDDGNRVFRNIDVTQNAYHIRTLLAQMERNRS